MSSTAQKIVIIEDDESQRDYLKLYINMWGYEVHAASDGPEGLDLISSVHPDLIILDLYLPTVQGLEVLKRIREDSDIEQVPVFILTADTSDEVRIICLSSGASEFITKPIGLADLSTKIQNALELLDYRRQIVNLNKKLEREKGILQRYFARDLVEKILNEEIRPELGGSILESSVMFFDVRGSTAMAESMGPKNYALLISGLFAHIMEIIFEHRGTIIEILGDGILATFGCPVSSGDDCFNAVRAAMEIRRFLAEFNEHKRPESLAAPLGYGIGIASGRIFAGNIGSTSMMKYAVMGNPVNSAARIQDMTKELRRDILIDGETVSGLRGRIPLEAKGDFTLRGREETSSIYAVR